MKVVIFEQCGDPKDVLRVVERPVHPPKTGEVRVDVLAAPIHNADVLQILGLYGRSPALPATPGGEAVGRVVELGAGVSHLELGATVFITTGSTWAQQVTGPAAAFIPLPAGDLDQLAMLVSSPATAHLLLNNHVDLEEGDWVLQSAANSAVGSAVVQMAKAQGLRTLNLVRRPEVVDDLKALGADRVLVGTEKLLPRIQEATGGAPVRLALDAVGGTTFSLLLKALDKGGTLLSYSQVVHEPGEVIPGDLIFKGLTVSGFWLTEWFTAASDQQKQALFGELIPQVARGALALAVDSHYGIEQIKDAVVHSMAGRREGKVILQPNR